MYSSIDRIDYAILDVLAVDGRASVSSIAERVGLSKTPCQIRLKKLQQLGYITGVSRQHRPTQIGPQQRSFC